MDKEYWEHFYALKHPTIEAPSAFARTCISLLEPGEALVELGSGNGRDSLFFAENGLAVTAYEQTASGVAYSKALADTREFEHQPCFVQSNFTELPLGSAHVDAVYSRFTLHSVTAASAMRTLRWSYCSLGRDGRLLVEARSVNDPLFGRGEKLGPDEFIHDGHYRRFLRLDALCQEVVDMGFCIEDAVESTGFAVYRDEDPPVIRLHCTKP